MRKTLILGLGILSFILFTSIARYIYVCQIKNHCGQDYASSYTPRPFSLSLTDGDSIILSGFEQFAFAKGSIVPALTANNQTFLDSLANILIRNPEYNLTIKGLFRSSEIDASSGRFENLGLARANTLSNLLQKRGVDDERIFLDYMGIADDDLATPVLFELSLNTPDAYDNGDLVKAQYRFENMTFSDANFEFNSAIFKPSKAFTVWADSVKTFLELNPNKSLNIIGHTDNVGTIIYNQDLGLRRAQAAKRFFEQRNIETLITTSTKGEKEPIATNLTTFGRQKNRRVNFVIE